MFHTAEKCSLLSSVIKVKNMYKVDRIEIQLLSINDDLDLIDTINAKIVSIHLPLPPFCDITNIIRIIKEQGKEYDFLVRVAKKCKENNCGMVIHADTTLEKLYRSANIKYFIDFIEKYDLTVHIENTTIEIKNGNESVRAPIQISNYINSEIGKTLCYPLLDTCHYMMVRDAFDSSLTLSLKQVITMYNSDKYYVHLCDKVGCGEDKRGGKHGFNFRYDEPLLKDILKTIDKYNPELILEIREDDYINSPNVKELEERIDRIYKEITN